MKFIDAMHDPFSDVERTLREIFGKGPNDRADQYRRALNAFAIKHGSMEETMFRLWFDEQRRLYDKATVA